MSENVKFMTVLYHSVFVVNKSEKEEITAESVIYSQLHAGAATAASCQMRNTRAAVRRTRPPMEIWQPNGP